MSSVLIRLEGPLQAWSTQIKLGIRDTDREPSKSGVIGLAAAALGMERHDDRTLARLASLEFAVRVDRSGRLLRDYHTAGGGRFRGRKYFVAGTSDCVPSSRYYVADASFVAALSGDDELVEQVSAAVRSPRWPLFLGRRACVPTVHPLIGICEGTSATAIREAPLAERIDADGALRIVRDGRPGEGEPRYDVPLSFADGTRQFGLRYVITEWFVPPSNNHASDG